MRRSRPRAQTQRLPDEPIERLALLIADLTRYAEQGGMPEGQSKAIYNTLMEGLAGLEMEEQAELMDRIRAWCEPPQSATS